VLVPTNIFGSLHLARRALVAHQTTLDTIGHNLANLSTPGYTRQRAELVSVAPRGGVDVQEIRRLRDRFLDVALLTEQQALGRSRAQAGLLDRLQAIVTDPPGTGLGAALDGLFQAFHDLSVSPTDPTVRITVVDRADRVAVTLRQMAARVDQLSNDLTTEIRQRAAEANELLAQIGELHRQIIATRGGPAPNDLLDQRDRLVGALDELVGVTALDREDGTVQLSLTGTGILLVDRDRVAPLTLAFNVTADTLEMTAGGAALPVTPRGGALAALLDARNAPTGAVKQARADLDALARGLLTEVNRLHTQGAGLTGFTTLTAASAVTGAATPLTAAGLAFPPTSGSVQVIVHDAAGAVLSTVTVPITAGVTTLDDVRAALDADPALTASISGGRLTLTATGGATFAFGPDTAGVLGALGLNTLYTGVDARTIALDPVVAADPTRLAAARADAAGLVHPGDGANALELARLRTSLVMSGGTATFVDYYGAVVNGIGSATRDALEAVERQQAATQLVEGLQQQTAGVSTDEELIALSQTQTAYAAAARFATTIDEVLQSLLGMGA
jgi:flagellar hook-associated protein 1 FlgK